MIALAWLVGGGSSFTPVFDKKEGALISPSSTRQSRTLACCSRKKTVSCLSQSLQRASSASLDWKNLGFSFMPTNCFVCATYQNGCWGELEISKETTIRIPIAATVLHYGQAAFEGLKAFACKDGSIRIFRPEKNAERLQRSASRIMMPLVPKEMFLNAVVRAVQENCEYIPPYGSGGSLYIRPFLFGSGARVGLGPSDEYTFIVFVVPVGDYYKGGLAPVTAVVTEDYDRAAPLGVGNVKVGGNYAADLLPYMQSKEKGYPVNLYLDPVERKYIEEFGTSNFIAIGNNKKSFITPNSKSILKSITNQSLMQLAQEELGLQVEYRKVAIDEVSHFDEVAACGTAVVITPVGRIVYQGRVMNIGNNPDQVGPVLKQLYELMTSIQFGQIADKRHWMYRVV
ncbi:branched-chain amino acid aminotransferase [Galdieria sulphuraria]|uniref:Branched-chain amino acid aminotransferase n=1 Tax=Galdieria sulphuraria TaxID=130081 RepID=M2Y932_GALSU|nr:branched-chain amino acid aminotransferase [Galdieria sulphuraria]EME32603.1 branched-chain amino acid aminotransferase [Galdieria sulphuraria]|eukprot:XP_005709123.1 branched-chain amino acid aminotransferase [Galdieria sulphuraria]